MAVRWGRCVVLAAGLLAGCAVSLGVVQVGPDTFSVSERRAPVLGGGPEAERAALAEAEGFCAQQGEVFAPVAMGPVGEPDSAYGPNGFVATFRCRAQGAGGAP